MMIVDSYNPELSEKFAKDLRSPLIRYYQGHDMIGTEIGAAAKNVMGIAAGMLDGENMTSLKGALMARGTREVARLIRAVGGNELSAYGLCHLGDYEATLFSQHSHNRMFGEKFVKHEYFDKLAEGVQTSYAIQAGREIRIAVKPEVVDDSGMVVLANEIAKKIESELEYPGQIKVNIIRETRASATAT